MKQIVKIAVTAVLVLVAMASLALLAGCLAENALITPESFRQTALSSGWIEGVKEKIRQDFEPLNDVSGVPAEVTDAFLEERLTDEICTVFWDGSAAVFPTEELTADLSDRIRLCAEKMREAEEIYVTEEEWAEMNENFPATAAYFVDAVRADVMLRGMGAYTESVTDHWSRSFPLLAGGCGILLLGSFLLLILIYKKQSFQPLYAAFFGAGLVLAAPALWLRAKDLAARLQVGPAYLKNFLIRLYGSAWERLLTAGVILAVLGLICGALAAVLREKKKTAAETGNGEEEHGPQVFE